MKIMDTELTPRYWRQLATRNGISRKCYEARLQRGYNYRQAATTPVDKKHQHRLGKYVAGSARQAALAAGLPESAVTQYRKRHPGTQLTDQQIVTALLDYHERKKNPIYKQARAKGLTTATVYRRLSVQGWSLEKALNTPPISASEAARIGNQVRNQKRQQSRALKNASTL